MDLLRSTLKSISLLIARAFSRIFSMEPPSTVYRFVVASYTDAVHTLEFDPSKPADDALKHVSSTNVGFHPSWVECHPSDRTLLFTGLEQERGELLALRYSPASGGLQIIDKLSSDGHSPCHILVTKDQLITGNYMSGTVAFANLAPSSEGIKLSRAQPPVEFSGTGPVTERQEGSHPHQVYCANVQEDDASIIELLVPDLGSDKVQRLRKDCGGVWEKKGSISLDERHIGGGPRHVIVKNSKLYILLELSSKLAVYSYDPSEGVSYSLLAEATLPMPHDIEPQTMLAAEILCPEPNMTFPKTLFYVSNRNDPREHGDIISILAEHEDGQTELNLVGQVLTGLKHVRGMVFFGPDDRYLIVGGAQGGGIKVFEREQGKPGMREVAHLQASDGGEGLAPTGFVAV